MSRTTNILIDEKKKKLKGINSGPNMWREEYPFPLKIYLSFSMSY